MENATKALLIAGSVLIVIVLIAVGLKILGSTQDVTDQVDNVSDMMEKSIFNSQFEQYEGNQKGSVVKTLFSKVVANNANAKNGKTISFTCYKKNGNVWHADPNSTTYDSNRSAISNYLSSGVTNCNFNVEIYLDDKGYVYRIKVRNQGM